MYIRTDKQLNCIDYHTGAVDQLGIVGPTGTVSATGTAKTYKYLGSDLLCGVPLSQSSGVGGESVKVHCYAKRNSHLISTSIASTNGTTAVINLV